MRSFIIRQIQNIRVKKGEREWHDIRYARDRRLRHREF